MRFAQGSVAGGQWARRTIAALLLGAAIAPIFDGSAAEPLLAARNPRTLEMIRAEGDLAAQRRHVWSVFLRMTNLDAGAPLFETWRGEGEVFGDATANEAMRGMRGFSRPAATPAPASLGAPVLAYTLYNEAAFGHIQSTGLNTRSALDRLRAANARDVPAFPSNAIVVKTAWWPVARDGYTAMPVWDPLENPARRGGNPYTSWRRVVAIDAGRAPAHDAISIDFAGGSFPHAKRIGIDDFHHVAVTTPMAEAIMRDPEGKRAVLLALGRPLEEGDQLALVGLNLMTREIDDWVWAAFWWHDRSENGPFAADRPPGLRAPWNNYLMQPAFDAQTPVAEDGGAHIAFNPWLEGRFPDGGKGGGTASNCMACHRRASYPASSFLPVTRGAADFDRDPALAPDRLRTSFLWSIALHSRLNSRP